MFLGTRKSQPQRSHKRRLGMETLESRAMLATLFVTSGADAGAGTFRDAVDQANANSSVTGTRAANR